MNVLSRWLVPVLLAAASCQTQADELGGLAELPPLDCAVLVTGGAFLVPDATSTGTFAEEPRGSSPDDALVEPIPIDAVVDVLQKGSVFRRVEVDGDPVRRRLLREGLGEGATEPGVLRMLQQARDAGFDYVLVVEDLQDGPIDRQGTNGRWPLTFATWVLLGVGALIPDRTFESRATLRVTVRDLQTGRVVLSPLMIAGAVDLSLIERSNALGILLSIVVPPFWVHDDEQSVRQGVRAVTERRLLLSLARELKGEPTRQRLREGTVAAMALLGGRRLQIAAQESLAAVRLRPADGRVDDAAVRALESALLRSVRRDGATFVYDAELPAGIEGVVQVLVATITGASSSATFVVPAGA